MEQDHCLGAHGDDRRDGVRDPGGSAGPPEGTGKAGLCRGRRRAERGRTGGGGGRRPAPEPIGPLLAKADPKKGEQIAKVCAACHTFTKGGPNKIGPNLWDITDEAIAEVPGYQFSAALGERTRAKSGTRKSSTSGCGSRRPLLKGTKMTFAGIPKGQDRADVIAYLETLK